VPTDVSAAALAWLSAHSMFDICSVLHRPVESTRIRLNASEMHWRYLAPNARQPQPRRGHERLFQ